MKKIIFLIFSLLLVIQLFPSDYSIKDIDSYIKNSKNLLEKKTIQGK
jgi:hypothetical protein